MDLSNVIEGNLIPVGLYTDKKKKRIEGSRISHVHFTLVFCCCHEVCTWDWLPKTNFCTQK